MSKTGASMYLRTDGTLLLVRGETTIEIQLLPRQLLELGVDAMRLSLSLDPTLAIELVKVMDEPYTAPSTEMPSCPKMQ